MKLFQKEDLLAFRFLARPTFCPDGSGVAFLVHQADREANRYNSNLWFYDFESKKSRQLTFSGREKFFNWNR